MRWGAIVLVGVCLAGRAQAQDEYAPPPPPQSPGQPAAPPPAEAAPPPAWVARGAADLIVLDKVSAHAAALSGRVGEALHAGSLTITVRACDTRPPDQASDAAVWLDIVDSAPGAAPFHGWMLLSAPAVSSFEHPIYDVRLAGCR